MKKILKISGRIGLLIIALIGLIYLGFRLKEYFTGNKYVDYLKKNKLVSAQINGSIPLKFDDAFEDNQLFLFGEIHETGASPYIDISTFKYLNQQTNNKIYIAEMDIAQAYYINQFLKDSSCLKLKEILKKWVVWIGQNNREYRENKWGNLKEYYQQLDKSNKFHVYGVNRLNDFDLLNQLLKEKLPITYSSDIPKDKDSLINWVSTKLPRILQVTPFCIQDSLLLVNIEFNVTNLNVIKSRDEFMYANLKRYYEQNNWKEEKIYGCFGLYHVLQGFDNTLAGRIKKTTFLNGNIVSCGVLYTNSYLTFPSQSLPDYLADKSTYTKLSYGNDNIFFGYIKGIEDFKRITDKNTINLFKLDDTDSPYKQTNRGLNNFNIIKLFGGIPIDQNKVTTDYIQYLFYIDGADWLNPDE